MDDLAIFFDRQKRLLERFNDDLAVIVCSGDLVLRNGDSHYPFRVHSDFFYLTGIDEPAACLILIKQKGLMTRIIIIFDPSPTKRLWDSHWQLNKNSSILDGYDYVYNWEDQADLIKLKQRLTQQLNVYCQELSLDAQKYFADLHFEANIARAYIAEMRLVKTPHEVSLIEQACCHSSAVYSLLYQTDPECWVNEALLEGAWIYEGKKRGMLQQAYQPIIAGGARACCLHYHQNNHSLEKDGVVLIDAGFEYQYYASDITRMIFLKKPNQLQAELYKLLLTIQENAIHLAKPGQSFIDIQYEVKKQMAQGLALLGIFEGSVDKIMEVDVPRCYMHGIGHHLGLDVHDGVGLATKEKPFVPGMVITIEPGFYFSREHVGDSRLAGIGMRIEDDILIEPYGNRVLSLAPKKFDDICYGL
jgi:Xaa-Pro aminopeptidase